MVSSRSFVGSGIGREASGLAEEVESCLLQDRHNADLLRRSGVVPGLKVIVYLEFGDAIRGKVLDVTDAALILAKRGQPLGQIPLEAIRAIARLDRVAPGKREEFVKAYGGIGGLVGMAVGRLARNLTGFLDYDCGIRRWRWDPRPPG